MNTGRWVTKPALRHVKGKIHEVVLPGRYVAADGAVFDIPVGLLTDGGSVPRMFWWLYPPFGEDDEPAFILHDVLYHCAEQFSGDDAGHISRARADALLREASEALNYRRSGADVIYTGVRVGGWKPWNAYRKAAKAGAAA